MPRPANAQAKSLRLVLVGRDEQAVQIRAFKELCARNDLKVSDVLYEKVEAFLKQHNWPPGNSQTVLSAFDKDLRRVPARKCYIHTCPNPAVQMLYYKPMEEYFPACSNHAKQLLKDARWRTTAVKVGGE